MNNCKHSIRKQYAIIFGLLLCTAVLLIGIFNLIFLNSLYRNHKQRVLLDAYYGIRNVASNGNMDSEGFDKALDRCASVYNLNILIIDSSKNTVKSTAHDENVLTSRLFQHIFEEADDSETIYEENGVKIQLTTDARMNLDYLELWGNLDSDKYIIMRSSIQSIKEATGFTNHVLVGVGAIITLFGIVIIWLISQKLTKPVMDLVSISEKMTQLDFSEKFKPSKADNEIDELGRHINILSENLEKNIIELKTANNELRKDIDRRNEMDEMRRDFVSNVSHELKTPIALIQGYAEGLKDCVNDDEESRNFYCDVITDEANRMNQLVRNLLDLNELEFGNNNVELAHFDIIEMIYNCVEAFDIIVKNQDIKLVLPDRDEKVFVWADEFMCERVLNNYLSNAIHYAKNENIIEIKLAHNENLLRISVYNSGDQIPEEIFNKLWTKFYKADKARSREYGGSGIGLSIVKASMDAIGHDYGVINKEKGVEFWFEVDANNKLS